MASKPAKSPQRKSAAQPANLEELNSAKEQPAIQLQRERQRVELFAEVTLKIRQSLQLKEILRTTVTSVDLSGFTRWDGETN